MPVAVHFPIISCFFFSLCSFCSLYDTNQLQSYLDYFHTQMDVLHLDF